MPGDTATVFTWEVQLDCGYTLQYRCSWYPAALAAPDGHLCWATRLTLIRSDHEPHPAGDGQSTTNIDRRPSAQPGDAAGAPRPFDVHVQAGRGTPALRYNVHATSLADAVTQAARACLARTGAPSIALTEPAEDGLPHIHVIHAEPVIAETARLLVIVVSGSTADRYRQLAAAYRDEHGAAYAREEATGTVPASNWHAMTDAAEQFADATAHLFDEPLATLSHHTGDNGNLCPFSGAHVEPGTTGAAGWPACPNGCATARLSMAAEPCERPGPASPSDPPERT